MHVHCPKINFRHQVQVYYVTYMDSLAKLLNVKPNIAKFLLTDVKLAHRLIFQGLVPYQYRLEVSRSLHMAMNFFNIIMALGRYRGTLHQLKTFFVKNFLNSNRWHFQVVVNFWA